MTMRTSRQLQKGFTLIELLVVIAIIGFLASIALVNLNSARMKAMNARVIADLRQIRSAITLLEHDTGAWPGRTDGVTPGCPDYRTPAAVCGNKSTPDCHNNEIRDMNTDNAGLRVNPDGSGSQQSYPNWQGPYLQSDLFDPWGSSYYIDCDFELQNGSVVSVLASAGPNTTWEDESEANFDDIYYIVAR